MLFPCQPTSEAHQSLRLGVLDGCSLSDSAGEEDAPPPNRPLHQSSGVVGTSGSGAGSGPALTTTLIRLFKLYRCAGFRLWLSTVPGGVSLYCSVWLPRPKRFCTSRVRAIVDIHATQGGHTGAGIYLRTADIQMTVIVPAATWSARCGLGADDRPVATEELHCPG